MKSLSFIICFSFIVVLFAANSNADPTYSDKIIAKQSISDKNSYACNYSILSCDAFYNKSCKTVPYGKKTYEKETICVQERYAAPGHYICNEEVNVYYEHYKTVCSQKLPDDCSFDKEQKLINPKDNSCITNPWRFFVKQTDW
jgi:hypothetical protein